MITGRLGHLKDGGIGVAIASLLAFLAAAVASARAESRLRLGGHYVTRTTGTSPFDGTPTPESEVVERHLRVRQFGRTLGEPRSGKATCAGRLSALSPDGLITGPITK